MTRRTAMLFAGAVLLAVGAACATWRRFPHPQTAHRVVPFRAVAQEFTAFAGCMRWTEAERKRARATTIYTGPPPSVWVRYAGIQQDGWLWVRQTEDSAFWASVLKHEWQHAAEQRRDPHHRGKAWDRAKECGAHLSAFDRFPMWRP